MSTVRFVWDMAPPPVRVVFVAAPVLFLAGLIAGLVIARPVAETEAGS